MNKEESLLAEYRITTRGMWFDELCAWEMKRRVKAMLTESESRTSASDHDWRPILYTYKGKTVTFAEQSAMYRAEKKE